MADRKPPQGPQHPEDPQASPERGGGYEGAGPEYGRGYGRDFAGGGRNQGFDGSWGQGYGGSVAPSDYREDFGGEAYGGGMAAEDYARSSGGRGEDFGADDRSWMDRCADDELAGRGHHRGQGPKHWSRGDRQLYEEVCERLLRDRLIDARGIEVEVEDGAVSLHGEARAAADPHLIERLVRETPGVRGVRLDLRVRQGARRPEPQPDDDHVDKSALSAPLVPGRAPPPGSAGAP
jgi:osmotically-inducible protein OsmY